MPLVPAPVYSAWFKRSSLVYRSFLFNFQNPLWQKAPPKGFSLCGFWWLAVSSLLILRPIVYLVLGLRWLVGLLRISALIRWTDSMVLRLIGGDPDPDCTGLPTVLGLMILGIIGLLGVGVFMLVSETYAVGQLLPGVSWLVALLTFLPCWIYAHHNAGREDRCKVEVYVRVVLLALLLALAVFHTAALMDMALWTPLAAIAAIWHGICGCAAGLWGGLKWCVMGVVSGLPYALLAVGIVLVVGVIGYIVSRFVPQGDEAGGTARLTKEQIQRNVILIVAAMTARPNPWTIHFWLPNVLAYEPAMELARSRVLTDDSVIPEGLCKDLEAFVLRHGEMHRQKTAARNAACQRVSNALAVVWKPVAAVGRQIGVACSYGWALVKAAKTKSCPYLRFED